MGDRNADSGRDGPEVVSRLFRRLTGKELWVVILVAWFSGGGSGLWVKAPDRWTGTQQKEYMAAQDKLIENLENRIEVLEVAQSKDDVHREDAAVGYKRIRQCEAAVAALRSRTDHNLDDIRELRERLSSER